jgi:hypothetical protein
MQNAVPRSLQIFNDSEGERNWIEGFRFMYTSLVHRLHNSANVLEESGEHDDGLSSTRGALKRMAAAKRLTEIAFPKRLGVEIRISCERFCHPLTCSSRW